MASFTNVLSARNPVMGMAVAGIVAMAIPASPTSAQAVDLSEEDYDILRSEMVATIEQNTMVLSREIGDVRIPDSVLEAFATVPRHVFVPEDIRIFSYLDTPLPVAEGATVSQPFITAYMLYLLDVGSDDEVLQAAIGGGYETAILAELAASVSGMEYHDAVASDAADRLQELGYETVDIRQGDIYYGWPENRQFDAILVRMAMPYVPEPLLNQLRPGGRLVAPIGPEDGPQSLTLFVKQDDGSIERRRGMAVRFQPLPGGMRL